MKNTPLSLNELVVDRWRLRDRNGAVVSDAALDAIASGLKSARTIAEQIEAASKAIMEDVTATPQANALKAKGATLALAERATKILDETRARTQVELTKIEKSMTIEAPKDAAELRGALRTMTQEQRGKALADDVLALAAAVSHPVLSGLHKADHDLLVQRMRRERYPDHWDRQKRLNGALQDLDRGGNALLQFVRERTEKPVIQQAEAAAQRSAVALAEANK